MLFFGAMQYKYFRLISLIMPGISVCVCMYVAYLSILLLESFFRAASFPRLSQKLGTLQSSYFAGVIFIIQWRTVQHFDIKKNVTDNIMFSIFPVTRCCEIMIEIILSTLCLDNLQEHKQPFKPFLIYLFLQPFKNNKKHVSLFALTTMYKKAWGEACCWFYAFIKITCHHACVSCVQQK